MQYDKKIIALIFIFCFASLAFADHHPIVSTLCENANPYNGPWKNETGKNVFYPKFVCQNDLTIHHKNQCWGIYNANPYQPTIMGLYGDNNHIGAPLKTEAVYVNQLFIATCADLYRQCLLDPNCKKCLNGSCG